MRSVQIILAIIIIFLGLAVTSMLAGGAARLFRRWADMASPSSAVSAQVNNLSGTGSLSEMIFF